MFRHRCLGLGFLLCATLLYFATSATAQGWNLSRDFSATTNPNGVWAFGSKPSLNAGMDRYTETSRIPASYGTPQLAGWSNPALDVSPYALKNVSGEDWRYDGRAVGGGIAVLAPQEVLLHPSSLSGRLSVVQWTTPADGLFSVDVEFQRFEQVEGLNSDYVVLKNHAVLPGGSGVLVGFSGPGSHARYSNSSLFLKAGETLEFAVGYGTDGTSNADGTIVRATIQRVSQPTSFSLMVGGAIPVPLGVGGLGFGTLLVGSTTREVIIPVINNGNRPLTIHGVSLSGANAGDFALQTGLVGATLGPGESKWMRFHFTPGAVGSRSAVLTIDDDAPDGPHTFALTGSGVTLGTAMRAYTITDLGTLGGTSSNATSINNRGQVVGTSSMPGAPSEAVHAFLYDGGVMRDLGTLAAGNFSTVNKINGSGQVVGWASDGDISSTHGPWTYHGVLYDATGIHDLGVEKYAFSINDAGLVVGSMRASQSTTHGFLLSGGVMRDLGAPAQWTSSAQAINASGLIAGGLLPNWPGSWHAAFYDSMGWHDLGTFGGKFSDMRGINDAGQIVGSAQTAGDASWHAYLYEGAGMRDLGTLGGANSQAGGINNVGQIVGSADTATSALAHAFFYSGGVMYDLGDLLQAPAPGERFIPRAINDRGQIVGDAMWGEWPAQVRSRAFLLTPVSVPFLVVSAAKLDFAQQPAGTTSDVQTLTLTNAGELPLTVDSLSLAGADAGKFAIVSDTGETTLATGASRTITISFTPTAAGICSAALAIGSNDSRPAAPRLVALSGTGIVPAVTLSSNSVNFDNQRLGTTSGEQTLTLTNSGPAPLVLSGVSITGPQAAEFSVAGPTGMTIDPGQSGTISVRFTPAARGSRSATLAIASNAPGSPHTVTLSGAGIGPVANISPGSLGFGSQPVGTTGNTRTVLLQNSGDAPLDIQNVQITGANASDFTITADGWTGAHLLPTQIGILNLSFTPTAAGSRTASLTVQDSAPDSPQSLPLAGTGTAAAVSLSPASLTFADQLVGTASAEQIVTLTNTGDAPLTIHGAHFTGANAGDFTAAADLSGVVLTPGQSRTIPVRFAPALAGNRSASLAVSDSAGDSPHTVTLSGIGTAPSVTFGISRLERPTKVIFGDQPVGTTGATQTLTVTNGGSGALTISSVTITGANAADFALAADPPAARVPGGPILAPGASRNFTLRFKPASKGSRSASLTLSDNAAGSPHNVALQGMGVMIPPPAPAGLELKMVSFKEIQLTWVPGSPETTSYAIWRKVGQGEFERCGGVSGMLNRFVDRHVSPNTTYTYRVRANGPGGVSGWSEEVGGTTPHAPPVAPTGLTARALSASQMELRWTDNSSDETSFAIWRKSGTGQWARAGGVPAGVSRFVDRNLAPDTVYSYQVRANGPGAVSGWSNQASGTTLPGPKAGLAGGK